MSMPSTYNLKPYIRRLTSNHHNFVVENLFLKYLRSANGHNDSANELQEDVVVDEEEFAQFLQAIRNKSNEIKRVRIEDNFLRPLSLEDKKRLCEAVGILSKLEEICFYSSSNSKFTVSSNLTNPPSSPLSLIPISVITACLEQQHAMANCLRVLRLDNIGLNFGNSKDENFDCIIGFTRALQNLPLLQKFELCNILQLEYSNLHIKTSTVLHLILETLSTISSLETIQLSFNEMMNIDTCTGILLAKLIGCSSSSSSPGLQNLLLENINLGSVETLKQLTEAIKKSSCNRSAVGGLKHLQLRNCNLPNAAGDVISDLLFQHQPSTQHNKSINPGGLERLNLENNQLQDEAIIAIATSLQSNSTLKHLNVQGNLNKIQNEKRVYRAILELLLEKKNTVLESFEVSPTIGTSNTTKTKLNWNSIIKFILNHNHQPDNVDDESKKKKQQQIEQIFALLNNELKSESGSSTGSSKSKTKSLSENHQEKCQQQHEPKKDTERVTSDDAIPIIITTETIDRKNSSLNKNDNDTDQQQQSHILPSPEGVLTSSQSLLHRNIIKEDVEPQNENKNVKVVATAKSSKTDDGCWNKVIGTSNQNNYHNEKVGSRAIGIQSNTEPDPYSTHPFMDDHKAISTKNISILSKQMPQKINDMIDIEKYTSDDYNIIGKGRSSNDCDKPEQPQNDGEDVNELPEMTETQYNNVQNHKNIDNDKKKEESTNTGEKLVDVAAEEGKSKPEAEAEGKTAVANTSALDKSPDHCGMIIEVSNTCSTSATSNNDENGDIAIGDDQEQKQENPPPAIASETTKKNNSSISFNTSDSLHLPTKSNNENNHESARTSCSAVSKISINVSDHAIAKTESWGRFLYLKDEVEKLELLMRSLQDALKDGGKKGSEKAKVDDSLMIELADQLKEVEKLYKQTQNKLLWEYSIMKEEDSKHVLPKGTAHSHDDLGVGASFRNSYNNEKSSFPAKRQHSDPYGNRRHHSKPNRGRKTRRATMSHTTTSSSVESGNPNSIDGMAKIHENRKKHKVENYNNRVNRVREQMQRRLQRLNEDDNSSGTPSLEGASDGSSDSSSRSSTSTSGKETFENGASTSSTSHPVLKRSKSARKVNRVREEMMRRRQKLYNEKSSCASSIVSDLSNEDDWNVCHWQRVMPPAKNIATKRHMKRRPKHDAQQQITENEFEQHIKQLMDQHSKDKKEWENAINHLKQSHEETIRKLESKHNGLKHHYENERKKDKCEKDQADVASLSLQFALEEVVKPLLQACCQTMSTDEVRHVMEGIERRNNSIMIPKKNHNKLESETDTAATSISEHGDDDNTNSGEEWYNEQMRKDWIDEVLQYMKEITLQQTNQHQQQQLQLIHGKNIKNKVHNEKVDNVVYYRQSNDDHRERDFGVVKITKTNNNSTTHIDVHKEGVIFKVMTGTGVSATTAAVVPHCPLLEE